MTSRRPGAAVGIGLAAGFISGLLGVGGGVVMVPGFTGLLAMRQRHAVANSLLAIIPIAIVGVVVYLFGAGHPEIHPSLALVLAVGSVVGAPLGAALAYRVPERALRVGLGLISILVAVKLLVG
jgi:uncharacterized membrane protein YfcA